MKYYLIFFLFITVLACNKSKDADPHGSPAPVISSYTVAQSSSTQNVLNISGKNFGRNKNDIEVKLDSISLTVTFVNDSQLVALIPASLSTSTKTTYKLVVTVGGKQSNTFTVEIDLGVHGWRYIGSVGSVVMGNNVITNVAFSDENRGMVAGLGILASSMNGGESWGGFFDGGHTLGYGMSVYDEDNMWIESNRFNIAYRNQHDPIFYNFNSAKLDTITTVSGFQSKSITGLYTFKPFRGYILNQEGSVFKVNGSFAPDAISPEYKSTYSESTAGSWDVQFFNISALDSNNMVMSGWPGVYPNKKLILIHKKAGVYSEYDLTGKLQYMIQRAQITDLSTIYLMDGFHSMYRFTNDTELTTLSISATAFCFADSRNGYAGGTDGNVYKTVDGGQNWSVDFVLRSGDDLSAIYIRDKKVWGITRNGGVIRYDP
jgi:hypothetical protein